MVWESLVVKRMENVISPPKLVSILLESDGVVMDTLILVHTESYEFLHGTFDVIRVAKDGLEFTGEGSPRCNSCGPIPLLNILPEMPLGGTSEKLYCVDDASPVCGVGKRFSIEN